MMGMEKETVTPMKAFIPLMVARFSGKDLCPFVESVDGRNSDDGEKGVVEIIRLARSPEVRKVNVIFRSKGNSVAGDNIQIRSNRHN
jgi:hypothetical protein